MRLLAAALVLMGCISAQAADFVVTNRSDSGPGTLRQKIFDANTSPASPHRITFNLPSPFTISPSNSFNVITNNILIDGSTQPGYAGTPIIRLTGTNAATSVVGLTFASSGGGVRGLRIEQFDDSAGVVLLGRSNVVEGCHIFSNSIGVSIGAIPTFTAVYARVGGVAVSNRNVISGNSDVGIYITTPMGRSLVQGNYIGLDPGGTLSYSHTNNFTGVLIVDSPSNTIGSAAAGARNIISGNRGEGVKLLGSEARNNRIDSNYIGTDAAGVNAVSNHTAIFINRAPSNTITDNVLSGNNTGLFINDSNAVGNTVSQNLIGVITNGAALPNLNGVIINAPRNMLFYNTISANIFSGVDLNQQVTTHNELYGNIIGLAPDGITVRSNHQYGVVVQNGASSNSIGVTTPFFFDRNVISGNGQGGVYISGTGSVGNVVAYNRIGTDSSGNLARGNKNYGVRVVDARATWIGDNFTGPSSANQISGNNGSGIDLFGSQTRDTRIEYNLIGLNAAGTGVVAGSQSTGVSIGSGANYSIGPGRNYIAGHAARGVYVGGFPTNVTIQNNVVGANTSATVRLPNGTGVEIYQVDGISVYDNVISGNVSNGILAVGSDVHDLIIGGNLIGLNGTGSGAVSNGLNGIFILNVPGTQIGTDAAIDRNIISGNGQHGILVGSGTNSVGTQIRNNFIGLNLSGTTALRNGGDGIHAEFTHGIEVGGPNNSSRNVIAGNQFGIYINKGDNWTIANNYIGVDSAASTIRSNRSAGIRFGDSSFSNIIERNVISGNNGPGLVFEDQCRFSSIRGNSIGVGTNSMLPLRNSGPGIFVNGCESMLYGGFTTSDANRIAFNLGPGIAITSIVDGLRLKHEIYGNLIYSNAGIAIDLNFNGVTPNDPVPDTDNGYANDFQNFPILTAAVRGSTIVSGRLESDAFFNPYRIEFFALTPTQGMVFIGATNLTLAGSGTSTFTYAFAPSAPSGSLIYATASLSSKGTSEFSTPIALTGGTLDSDGDLMPDVWESAYGLNPSVSNAVNSDADGDGQTDLHEWIADTIPNNSNSVFQIVSISGGTPRVVLLPSSATRLYRLEGATSLVNQFWYPIQVNVPGNGTILGMNDASASGSSSVYRASVRIP